MGWMDREEKLALALGTLLNLVFYFPVLLGASTRLGKFDSDYHFYLIEAVRKSLFEYWQLPFWDPWHMGGMALLGNPQVPLSPLYFPVILFGTLAGTKVSVVLLSLIGFWGAYRLSREVGLGFYPGLLAATVWCFNGVNVSHMQGGWFLFSHLHLFPLTVWAFLRWKDDLRYSVPFSVILSLMVLGGSPYPLPILFLLLGSMSVFFLARKNRKPLAFIGISLALCIGVSAIKTFPVLAWVQGNPRDLSGIIDGYSLTALYYSVITPGVGVEYYTPDLFKGTWLKGVKMYAAVEYAFYLGPLALILMAVGLFHPFRHKWSLIFGGGVALVVMLGDHSPLPLWDLLKQFPVYDNMRVVARYKYAFLVPASLLCGAGLSLLADKVKGGAGLQASVALIAFAMFMFNGYPLLADSFKVPLEKVRVKNPFPGNRYFQVYQTTSYSEEGWLPRSNIFHIRHMYPYLLQNIGVTLGYEPFPYDIYAKGKGSPEYRGEAFLHDGAGFYKARFGKWSPNKVELLWDAPVSGVLYLNQNHQPGWRVCGDAQRQTLNLGITGVEVGQNESRLELCYSAPYGYLGLTVSVLFLGGAAVYSCRLFTRRERGAL